MQQVSAPLFTFGGSGLLSVDDTYLRGGVPSGELALSGPSVVPESGNLPVRGDLAHIRLAGQYFVPHYAVPMAFFARAGGAHVLRTAQPGSGALCTLAARAVFNVLDISGGWAWGQVDDDGPVGYVALDEIEARG